MFSVYTRANIAALTGSLVQCAIPAFEGLLPSPHDERVTGLLFTFGRWHGFAKLRLHTDHTLKILDDLTSQLGEDMRAFLDKTCSKFETKELAREYQARKRREARKSQSKAASNAAPPAPGALEGVAPSSRCDDSTCESGHPRFHSGV